MARKKYTPEEIIQHLRTLQIAQSKGQTIEEVAKRISVHPVTLSKWKREYGGMEVNQAKKLKDLEKENARLKKLLAESELDKSILKEALTGNY